MRTLSMCIVSYLIKNLGEFELIFETILDYGSGDQMGSFDAKNRHRKSHSWAPLTKPKNFAINVLEKICMKF
jgi:hypothetical protein